MWRVHHLLLGTSRLHVGNFQPREDNGCQVPEEVSQDTTSKWIKRLKAYLAHKPYIIRQFEDGVHSIARLSTLVISTARQDLWLELVSGPSSTAVNLAASLCARVVWMWC